MQILTKLGLEIFAVAISIVRGVPIIQPIENKQFLLNKKSGEFGKLTYIGMIDD